MKEAGITAFRWPGGCCADHYHWQDGIGPKRYDRLHFVLKNDQHDWRNDFGTDEFIRLCRLAELTPILTANSVTGTAEEFLSWFEYCNGGVNTKYGSMRAENGHPEPYNVMYWGIGNTDENAWHAASPALRDSMPYALRYLAFTGTNICRSTFPELKYIGLGMSIRHKMNGWTENFLDYVTDKQHRAGPDLLSVHHYLGGMKDKRCGPAVGYSAEEYEYLLDSLVKYQQDIDYHRRVIAEHTNPRWPTYISFDEWGTWHPEATSENGTNQRQTMRDTVFAALALHIFYRNADIVKTAMQTQTSNLLESLFETRGKNFCKTPTFYVMKLFKEHLGQTLLSLPYHVAYGRGELLSGIGNDRITVTAVNRELTSEARFEIDEDLSQWKTAKADIIASDNIQSENTFDDPFTITDRPFSAFGQSLILPPHSIVRFVLIK